MAALPEDGSELTKFLDFTDLDTNQFFGPLVKECDSEEWQKIVSPKAAGIRRAAARRWLLSLVGREFRRTEDYVEKYYARWDRHGLADADPWGDIAFRPGHWRGRRILSSPWATNRLTLLRLIKTIEFFQPHSVLEVGAGNGLYPLMLSCVFPEIEFRGVELTSEGVEAGKKFMNLPRLPTPLEKFIPGSVKDVAGFKKVTLDQGSARSMPYEQNSFDLVYSCLALEQMEDIRSDVLREMSRVSKMNFSFIEPFADVNDSGLHNRYIYSMNYFKARSSDLSQYGMDPIYFSSDFPQAFYMNVAHVLALKSS